MDDCFEQEPTRRRTDDRGSNLIEYALLVALIVIACVAAASFFADATSEKMYESCDAIASAGDPTPTSCA